jgi:hypothetical protein
MIPAWKRFCDVHRMMAEVEARAVRDGRDPSAAVAAQTLVDGDSIDTELLLRGSGRIRICQLWPTMPNEGEIPNIEDGKPLLHEEWSTGRRRVTGHLPTRHTERSRRTSR